MYASPLIPVSPGRPFVWQVHDASVCRRACKACQACQADDWDCIHGNRKAAGYLELKKDEMEWLGVPWWMGNGREL
jgi:hypothetical protein